jgi:plasmid rolling circle replication initiator protein Rep
MNKYDSGIEKNQVVLTDRIGKRRERPWRKKKMGNTKLAKSFERLGYVKKAARTAACGTHLDFGIDTQKTKHLIRADFCRERLCPMCAWRRSLKVFSQVSQVMQVVFEQHPKYIPLFLTLTLKNCNAEDLSGTLDQIFRGWKILFQRKDVEIVKGWFRALEVTHNQTNDTYHPHIHAILIVPSSYLVGKNYISTVKWVKLWRECLSVEYDPVCDIRRIKIKDGEPEYKVVAEVSKYTTKETSYLKKDESLTDKLVKIFGDALKGRRLYAFGGILRDIAKALKLQDLEKGDYVRINDDNIRSDIFIAIEKYHWHIGIGNYVKTN